MANTPLVSIVMGSDSDLDIMNEAAKALADLALLTKSTSPRRTAHRRAPASTRAG